MKFIDRETIAVYSDSYCLVGQPLIGVAVCYVGDMNTELNHVSFM